MNDHPLTVLSRRYPCLLLPVRSGEKDTDEYKDAVLRGKELSGIPDFTLDENDSLSTVFTPAGEAEILILNKREDFEHAIRCLANRCEPVEIPPSMGASFISGLINWEKIRPHMGSDEEFSRFTSDKSNYLDRLLVLSTGDYSAVGADKAGLDEKSWREKSVEIRKYHELTHFISGKLFPDNKEALRDEVVADAMGLMGAFGAYDVNLARIFLGIEGDRYREGGRLQNYVGTSDVNDAMQKALRLTGILDEYLKKCCKDSIFDVLINIEGEKLGI